MANRMGVLGGSFNPVHNGHLHLASCSRNILGLSGIHFVVAGIPPHKPPENLIPFHHRYAMVSLATAGCPHLFPSQVELEPPVSPFTFETLAKLARRFDMTGKELYFIAGGDSLLEVAGWHQSELLLQSYNFVFIMRPGVNLPDIRSVLPDSAAARVVDCRNLVREQARTAADAGMVDAGCRIFLLDAGAPDIAASQVRTLAAAGKPIGHLVPATVSEYILKLHLYGE